MDCRLILFLSLMLLQYSGVATPLTDRLSQLQQSIEQKRVELDIPAVVVMVVDKDHVVFAKTFGIADRKTGVPVSEDHYIRIGSITKTVTALAVLRLIEEGRLSLEDKLIDIAPELDFDNPWQTSRPVTIAQLLEHTAGLNDLTKKEFEFNEPLSLAEAFKLSPGSRVSRWPPGLHHSYSNVSPGILAYVIEKVTGLEFEEYVQRAVLIPLGMDSATFFPEPRVLDNLVTGYNTDGESVIPYWHMTYRAFGALNLKPGDMVPFLQLFLNEGRHDEHIFLSADLMQRMETPGTTLAARSGLRFGYSCYLYPFFRNGYLFYGHGGDADGYLSRFGYQKDAGLAYFVSINVFRDKDLVQMRQLLEEFIIENLPAPEFKTVIPESTILADYAGQYTSVTWRFPNAPASEVVNKKIRVQLNEEQLVLIDTDGDEKKMYPVNDQHFRFRYESVPTMAFVRHEGELYLQTDFGNFRKTGP